MSLLLSALAVAAGAHVLVLVAMAWRVRTGAPPPAAADLPDVVVAVAARDEEATIARCLAALLAQDYPAERLTVVVADDHSVDRTAAIVRGIAQQAARRPVAAGADAPEVPEPAAPAVRCLRVPAPAGELRGKAQALHEAIAATTAPLILVTDADCAPPPTWVRATVGAFASPDVGIVCGMSRIAARPGRAFDRAQALDWALLVGATSALVQAGLPATGMGNNMALRRAAYDSVGGYPALPFSVTEDHTLVRAVASHQRASGGRWRIRFPLSPATTVWTLPAENVRHAYAQRRRWARGGLAGGLPVWAAYAALHAGRLLPLAALVAAPAAAFAAVGAMAAANAALLAAVLARTGPPLRLRDLLGMEAFQWLYLVTLPAVLALAPGIEWKGRRHGTRAPRPRPRRR